MSNRSPLFHRSIPTCSLQLIVNSENELAKADRQQVRAGTAGVRHNLRLFVERDLLVTLTMGSQRRLEDQYFQLITGMVDSATPFVSLKWTHLVPSNRVQGSRGLHKVFKRVNGVHYLQKGMSTEALRAWVLAFKRAAHFETMPGAEGWWVRSPRHDSPSVSELFLTIRPE